MHFSKLAYLFAIVAPLVQAVPLAQNPATSPIIPRAECDHPAEGVSALSWGRSEGISDLTWGGSKHPRDATDKIEGISDLTWEHKSIKGRTFAARALQTDKIASLIFSAGLQSIPIDVIRASNATADRLENLVAVFVGGTNGIGESTLREYFARTTNPKAYIIGRNEIKAKQIIEDVTTRNEGAKCHFIQCDITLIKNVDEACRQILRKESKINVLFLTAGFLTVRGRSETVEGIDRKMCCNYYGRMRFVHNLMPQLAAAARDNQLSRVLSVLAAGSEAKICTDDLGLKHNFSLHGCMAHCVVMTDFMFEELAKRYPGTSFSHSYPGTVKSGITNELPAPIRLAVKVLYAISSPWIIQLGASGERHFFQMTSNMYPAKRGSAGLPIPEGFGVCKASEGTPGGGSYLLDWDAQATGDQDILQPYREEGLGQKVWDHTMETFEQATSRKRPASSPKATHKPKDPPNWRAGKSE